MKKKLLYSLGIIGILSTFFFFLLPLTIVNADPLPKVWVCKYAGIPGENEFLKPGKQPIVVSSNATVGTYFNDAHGRSYVLDLQTDANTDSDNSYIGGKRCPNEDAPIPDEHLSIDKTGEPICVEGGVDVLYTIDILNDGNSKITVYSVTDTLDAKIDCSQVREITQGGVCLDGKIIWGEFTLDMSENGISTYKVFVTDANYDTYTNQVSAIYGKDELEAYDSLKMELYCEIEEPTYCEETIDGDTVWSAWVVDQNDDTQKMRTGTISLWDAEDNTYSCGTRTLTEYQPIEDEGDVLGESDEKGEVLGTSIVSADTAGGSNPIINIIEYLLIISTGISFIFLGKRKLQLK